MSKLTDYCTSQLQGKIGKNEDALLVEIYPAISGLIARVYIRERTVGCVTITRTELVELRDSLEITAEEIYTHFRPAQK